jgi:hypothetical protein
MFANRSVAVSSLVLLLSTVSPVAAGPIFTDPVGDTFGSISYQPDITAVRGDLVGKSLVFRVDFAGAVLPPSANPSTPTDPLVEAFIDIDTDRNRATGAASTLSTFGLGDPAPGLGVEFSVDLGSEANHPGFADVVNTTTQFATGLAPVTFGPTWFSVAVPLSLIGNSDGHVNYGVLVGSFAIEPTDQAPNPGAPGAFVTLPLATTVPEPASALAFGVALSAVVASRLRLGLRRRPTR